MISIILLGVFCALNFTGLITFAWEPIILVICLITLLIKPALGLRPEPFHSTCDDYLFLCPVNEVR